MEISDNNNQEEACAVRRSEEPVQRRIHASWKGKNSHRWPTMPNAFSSTPKRNIVHFIQEPSNKAKEGESYALIIYCKCFASKNVEHANANISLRSEQYATAKYTNSKVKLQEPNALISFFIFSVARKNNHLPMRKTYNAKILGMTYKATMSCELFEFLLNCLRLNDKTTREKRKANETMAAIREIWC